ncbi:hypothetical protein E4U41_001639 [Claviceps citrina]|nr:hypothetical protein E4U41_001639 [Claviceps citrina]
MAIGLERLERLFTYKRKASREPSPTGQSASTSRFLDQQFPSPSFIRPKATRMTARQEVRLRQATYRSPSVPDIQLAPRLDHSLKFGSVCADSHQQPKHRLLARLPSPSHDQTESLVSVLREFQFPKPPSRNGPASPLSTTFHKEKSTQSPQLPRSRRPSPLEMSIPVPCQLDTPPSSDPEDNGSDSPSPTAKGPPVSSLSANLPTPDQTPEIGSTYDARLRGAKSADCLEKAILVENHLGGHAFDQRSMDRTYSQSSIADSDRSFCSSTLREPDLSEFLNLSDDDIAESAPDSPILAPVKENGPSRSPASDLWISSSEPLTSRLITLTPPRASRPATAAAFEAARIAKRYDFDLVYVVNLWPNTFCPRTSTQRPMIGRLLAAHGLHHVPCPLEISEEVHTTILRSDGWIEYRDQDALPHDIARGYACAFHTGQYARSGSSRCASPVSGVRLSERIDRGIVFAAYRKPRRNDKLGRTFGEAELGELHRDAEALVEMVIDIQAASRSRQPPSRHFPTDDTGPIPTPTQKF